MPAGVRAAFNLPPASVPQAFDFRKLPKTAGPARIDGAFFEMSLPAHAAVLKVPHGRKEFFVECEGHTYGPAEGNPVVELGLTEMLRKTTGRHSKHQRPGHARGHDPERAGTHPRLRFSFVGRTQGATNAL